MRICFIGPADFCGKYPLQGVAEDFLKYIEKIILSKTKETT